MRLFPFVPFILAYVVPGLAGAQSNTPTLTAEDAVTAAIKNNPRLSAATRDVLAARSGVRSARALTNPDIVFTPAITGGGSDTELLVQQPLELNGVRSARTGAAQARLRGVEAQAVVELRGLVFATRSAYYDLARAREQLALARDLQRVTEELDRIARRLVELGRNPAIETVQTGIEVIRARQQTSLAESQERSAVVALNTQMGRGPEEPVPALSPLPASVQTVDLEGLVPQALAARAEITAAEAEADTLRQEARQARGEGLPDLAPQFRATRITRGVNEAGLGVALTLPLLDWGSRRNRVRQLEQSARGQQERAVSVRNQVRQEVSQAVSQVQATGANLQAYQQGILDQSRRLLDASRVGYEEGKTGIAALLEAQRTFRTVQNEYISALVSYALARAELERATGAVPASRLTEVRRP